MITVASVLVCVCGHDVVASSGYTEVKRQGHPIRHIWLARRKLARGIHKMTQIKAGCICLFKIKSLLHTTENTRRSFSPLELHRALRKRCEAEGGVGRKNEMVGKKAYQLLNETQRGFSCDPTLFRYVLLHISLFLKETFCTFFSYHIYIHNGVNVGTFLVYEKMMQIWTASTFFAATLCMHCFIEL